MTLKTNNQIYPMDIPEKTETPNGKQRIKSIIILIIKIICLLGLLYIFVCSLDLMSSAFRLVGGKYLFEIKIYF